MDGRHPNINFSIPDQPPAIPRVENIEDRLRQWYLPSTSRIPPLCVWSKMWARSGDATIAAMWDVGKHTVSQTKNLAEQYEKLGATEFAAKWNNKKLGDIVGLISRERKAQQVEATQDEDEEATEDDE